MPAVILAFTAAIASTSGADAPTAAILLAIAVILAAEVRLRNVLPAQSVCLIVPIKKLSEHDEQDAAGRDVDSNGTQAKKASRD